MKHNKTLPGDNRAIMGAIAAASLDALITIDYDGNIVEFSPVAESMFGYQRNEVLGKPVSEVVIPPRLRQAHSEGMERYHRQGTGPVINTRVEVPAIRRSGEEFPAELTVVPLEIPEGKFFTAFVRDITELKAQQEATENARKAAEEANEAKSRFLAHMSHELRSPLTTVLGAIDILKDAGLDAEQQRFASMAQNSGESLLELISDILEFSRIESGQLELENKDTDLRPLIDTVIDEANNKAQRKSIHLGLYVDPEMPTCVSCDPKRIRQILVNLIDNAIKFTDSGAVGLYVEVIAVRDEKIRLRFQVVDTGIGIDEQQIGTIFEEFAQVDESDATDYPGTGLGLAIVKLIAKLMNGAVSVDSQPGKGSEFTVDLDMRIVSPSAAQPVLNTPLSALMLVDQPIIADILVRQLSDLGVKTLARQRLSCLSNGPARKADLILVGLMGKQITAKTLKQAIRATALNPQKLCVLTPPGPVNEEACALLKQVGGHLTLPTAINELHAVTTKLSCSTHLAGNPLEASLPPKRILLAEDSPTNQAVLTSILRSGEYDVSAVANGKEAVKAVAQHDFDLVLMDLRMPEMDGNEATRAIRQLAKPKCQVRIVALTANALQQDIDRCLAAGMDDYIIKPIKKAALLEIVARHLDEVAATV